jgi:hypothetical protein
VDLRLLGPLEASLENRPIELGPASSGRCSRCSRWRMAVLASKRVGNVQHSPAWFTLLDQMWVR